MSMHIRGGSEDLHIKEEENCLLDVCRNVLPQFKHRQHNIHNPQSHQGYHTQQRKKQTAQIRDSAVDKVKTLGGHSNLAACKYFKICTDI